MRKLRVTASMKKQLQGLRDSRTGAVLRGGVMHVPRILSCDEFEAIAAPMQDALIAASYEDRERQEQAVVSRAVRPSNANDDHIAANRAMGEARRQGGRPYLEAKEEQVRQATQPPAQPYRARSRGPTR